MVNMLYAHISSTVALLVFTILGVAGHVESVEPYRDTLIWRTDLQAGFAFGGMIAVGDVGAWQGWLDAHEYGHVLQEREFMALYPLLVAIPSMVSFQVSRGSHPRMWWERDATIRGHQ